MLPSLARMPAAATGAPTANYEDNFSLVIGGCRPDGTPAQSKCFDDWFAKLTERALENQQGDTIVVLSAGSGVLELRALSTLLAIRAEAEGEAIKHVLLIDPGTPASAARDVETEFRAKLLGVDVKYYEGDRAYDNALTDVLAARDMRLAVVGAINFGTVQSTHKVHRNLINTMIALLELMQRRSERNVYVVQAFENVNREIVHRDQTVLQFTDSFKTQLNLFTELHLREWQARASRRRGES